MEVIPGVGCSIIVIKIGYVLPLGERLLHNLIRKRQGIFELATLLIFIVNFVQTDLEFFYLFQEYRVFSWWLSCPGWPVISIGHNFKASVPTRTVE